MTQEQMEVWVLVSQNFENEEDFLETWAETFGEGE